MGANMNLKRNWKSVIDKFMSKLTSWKAKAFLFRRRLTLMMIVLGNLPTYFLSLFVAPDGVLEQMEKIRRNFLWDGSDDASKISWVLWDKITVVKDDGGIGVGSIRALNIALLVKWWWRLRSVPSLLWSRFITSTHNLHSKHVDYLANSQIPGLWKNIVGVKKELMKFGIPLSDFIEYTGNENNAG